MEHYKSLLMNSSLANMNATEEFLDRNTAKFFPKDQVIPDYPEIIIFSVLLIICCIGVPLNGIVIWLLGFHVKRNPFTVLILNLAISDFGFLMVLAIFSICYFIKIESIIFFSVSDFMYINGLFLLAAISIDRCVCVLFPIWHRCSRPKYLSPAVCASLWICSFLLVVIKNIVEYEYDFEHSIWQDFHLIVTTMLCFPLITISTLILFVKICLKPKQIKRRRLLVMILITLLCFLILNLPLNLYGLFGLFFYMTSSFIHFYLPDLILLGSSLNSSVNPVIYYLFGRKKRAQTKESIKVIFQRVFKEDEAPESTEKAANTVPTPL